MLPRNDQTLLTLLGSAQQFAMTEAGKALRVTVHSTLDNGLRMRSEVVILMMEQSDQPFFVLSWQDDVGQMDNLGTKLVGRS